MVPLHHLIALSRDRRCRNRHQCAPVLQSPCLQEEENAREAEGRMAVDEQAALNEYIGHRNYDNLSSRSPDDEEEEEVGLYMLYTMRSVAGLLGQSN